MKRILQSIIVSVLLSSLIAPSATFAKSSDIKGHYFEHDLQSLINKGIMSGYGKGIYQPNKEVTRAEFTALLLSTMDNVELPNLQSNKKAQSFTDVKPGHWHYSTIQRASEQGLVGGYGDGTFRPNAKVTRLEMAIFLKRAIDKKAPIAARAKLNFKDTNKIGSWAIPEMEYFVTTNILAGTQDKNGNRFFLPSDFVSRGQSAAFLNRTLDYLNKPSGSQTTYKQYPYDFKKMEDMQTNSTPKVDGNGTYTASRALVSYYANPSNFAVDSSDYFQFLILSRSTGVPAKELNDKFLTGRGTLTGQGAAFVEAANTHKINEVYLITHALHETDNGKSKLASGIEVGQDKDGNSVMVTSANRSSLTNIKKTYNMFGVLAYDHCPNKCGAEHAYDQGWFTPHAAIVGGATFISGRYIDAGQDTLYKMRWNPESKINNEFGLQYATHVAWATSQAKRMHDMYARLNTHSLAFEVPVFRNQPRPSAVPTGVHQYAVLNTDQKKAWTTAKNPPLNMRQGPTTSFPIIQTIPYGTEVSILGHNGGWYKIKVGSNEGWVFGEHLTFNQVTKASTMKAAEVNEDNESNETIIDIKLDTMDEDPETNTGLTINEPTSVYTDQELTGAVQTELPKDTEVTIVDKVEHAYHIVIDNIEGWVSVDDAALDVEDNG